MANGHRRLLRSTRRLAMPASFLKKLAGFTGVLLVLWLIYLYRQIPHARTPFARGEDLMVRDAGYAGRAVRVDRRQFTGSSLHRKLPSIQADVMTTRGPVRAEPIETE